MNYVVALIFITRLEISAQNELERLYHYTTRTNAEAILKSGVIKASNTGAAGSGVYFTKLSASGYDKNQILCNNYGSAQGRENSCDYVIEVLIPKQHVKDISQELERSVLLVPHDIKLDQYKYEAFSWSGEKQIDLVQASLPGGGYVKVTRQDTYPADTVTVIQHGDSSCSSGSALCKLSTTSVRQQRNIVHKKTTEICSSEGCKVLSDLDSLIFSDTATTTTSTESGLFTVSARVKASTRVCKYDICHQKVTEDYTRTYFTASYKAMVIGGTVSLLRAIYVNRNDLVSLLAKDPEKGLAALGKVLWEVVVGTLLSGFMSVFPFPLLMPVINIVFNIFSNDPSLALLNLMVTVCQMLVMKVLLLMFQDERQRNNARRSKFQDYHDDLGTLHLVYIGVGLVVVELLLFEIFLFA